MSPKYSIEIKLFNGDHSLEKKIESDFIFAAQKRLYGKEVTRLFCKLSEEYDLPELINSIYGDQWEETRKCYPDETLGEFDHSVKRKYSYMKIFFMKNRVVMEKKMMFRNAYIEMPTNPEKDPLVAINVASSITSYNLIIE